MNLIHTSPFSYPPFEAEILALLVATVAALVAMLLRLRPPRFWQRSPGLASRLVLALVFVAILEGTLRAQEHMAPASPHRLGPNLTWTLTPGLRNHPLPTPLGTTTVVSTNELGLREVEVPLQRREGEYRILCVGDSWTFGQGVPVEATYCKRLQSLLCERHPRVPVTVVNAGVGGFSYFQGYYLLKHVLPLYQPDLVIVGGFNELSNGQVPEMEEALPDHPLARDILSTLQQSRSYLLLRKEVYRFKSGETAGRPTRVGPLPRMDDAVLLRYATAMLELAEAAGAPCIMFQNAFQVTGATGVSPRTWQLTRHPTLRRLPSSEHILAVEICPVRTEDERHSFMQARDPFHPDARGHEAMAHALCDLIEARRLVPPAR